MRENVVHTVKLPRSVLAEITVTAIENMQRDNDTDEGFADDTAITVLVWLMMVDLF
jgi:hypothetical protein